MLLELAHLCIVFLNDVLHFCELVIKLFALLLNDTQISNRRKQLHDLLAHVNYAVFLQVLEYLLVEILVLLKVKILLHL